MAFAYTGGGAAALPPPDPRGRLIQHLIQAEDPHAAQIQRYKDVFHAMQPEQSAAFSTILARHQMLQELRGMLQSQQQHSGVDGGYDESTRSFPDRRALVAPHMGVNPGGVQMPYAGVQRPNPYHGNFADGGADINGNGVEDPQPPKAQSISPFLAMRTGLLQKTRSASQSHQSALVQRFMQNQRPSTKVYGG